MVVDAVRRVDPEMDVSPRLWSELRSVANRVSGWAEFSPDALDREKLRILEQDMKELMSYSEKPGRGELALIAECSWWLTQPPGVAVYPDGFADQVLVTGSARVYLAGTAKR